VNRLQKYHHLKFELDNLTSDQEKLVQDLNEHYLRNESFHLGNQFLEDFYTSSGMLNAIRYHEYFIKSAAEQSISSSLLTMVFASIVMMIVRYIFKGAKWVEKTSKKEI